MDKQGRVLLPQVLRETAAMVGEVSVLGQQNHLAVWNRRRLQERLFKKEPFTEEDGKVLSGFGI
jgi:MraZ protein